MGKSIAWRPLPRLVLQHQPEKGAFLEIIIIATRGEVIDEKIILLIL